MRSYSDNYYNRSGSNINNGIKGARTFSRGGNNNTKEIKCWGCNGFHLYKKCSHNPKRKISPFNMLQEASTFNGIARNIPRINASLED